MKKNLTLIVLLLLAGLQQVYAQTSATASFTASVTVIQPIGISTTSNMNFASIDAQSGGAVILTADDTRISTGGVILKHEENVSAATFVIKGQPGFTFNVTLPEDSYSLTNGEEEMTIKQFTSNITSDILLTEGTHKIRLGATLQVNPNQTPGIYTSPTPMNVTVNYN